MFVLLRLPVSTSFPRQHFKLCFRTRVHGLRLLPGSAIVQLFFGGFAKISQFRDDCLHAGQALGFFRVKRGNLPSQFLVLRLKFKTLRPQLVLNIFTLALPLILL